VDCQEEEAMDC